MTLLGKGNTGASKLSAGEVVKIREQYANGATQGALSRAFGVSVIQIGRIVRGEVWQNLPRGFGKAPSEGEIKTSMERMQALQEAGLLEAEKPPVAKVPASPLDGGEAPSEASGSVAKLQQSARSGQEMLQELLGGKPNE